MLRLSLRLSAAFLLVAGTAASAPEPDSGTVSPAAPLLTFSGSLFVSDPSGATCGTPGQAQSPTPSCDEFELTISVPPDYGTTNPEARVRISMAFDDIDYDLYVLDDGGSEVDSSAGSSNPEVVQIPATAGVYTVQVLGWNASGGTYQTTITLLPGGGGGGGGGGDDGDSCVVPGAAP